MSTSKHSYTFYSFVLYFDSMKWLSLQHKWSTESNYRHKFIALEIHHPTVFVSFTVTNGWEIFVSYKLNKIHTNTIESISSFMCLLGRVLTYK